jgi:hypothetical protein
MAVDPRLALVPTTPDFSSAFSNALLNVKRLDEIGQAREEAPIRQRLLEAQTAGTEAKVPTPQARFNVAEKNRVKSLATGARQILPDLQRGNIEQVISSLQRRRASLAEAGISTKETDEAIELAQTNPNELVTLSQQAIELDRQLSGVTGAKPTIKEGVTPEGKPGFFAVTPTGATQIPGIAPAPRAPLVQIGGEGKAAEQKELAKLRAQDLKALRAKGSEAEQQLNSLNVLDNIDVSTGAAEPMKLAIASFAEGFGIDASNLANVAAGQAFTSEAGRTVLRVMSTQKGPQTDRDADRIAKTLSRLGNRPEANRFINDSARAIANRALDQRDFHDAWLDQNDSLKGAASAWNKLKRNAPMVSQHVQDANGLPVFFFRFKERVLEANPGATNDQVLNAWRRQEKTAKKARK